MPCPEPVALFWSTGKDSALALYELKKSADFHVAYLIITCAGSLERVMMHGIPRHLAEIQVRATGIPHRFMNVPLSVTNESYEQEIRSLIQFLKKSGIKKVAFGDIFLEDLRSYREELFHPEEIETLFPLWKKDTGKLITEMIRLGFKARVICCDSDKMGKDFCGRELDADFLHLLPENVDPCGENGEYHTFCYEGPIFRNPILFSLGSIHQKEYSIDNHTTKKYFFLEIR